MIKENIESILSALPSTTRLIAVSKTKPVENIQEAYDCGQHMFGENKALEMRDKHEVLPNDIAWHFIGHLQTNKIKYIISYVTLIHSIDTLNLLQAVNHEAAKHGRIVDCLLQFHVAAEETKFGLTLDEGQRLLESDEYQAMNNIRIVGVMGMATNTTDQHRVRDDFRAIRQRFDYLKEHYFRQEASFKEISMGMSHDYAIAVDEGSTLIRIGSAIFGERNYNIPVND